MGLCLEKADGKGRSRGTEAADGSGSSSQLKPLKYLPDERCSTIPCFLKPLSCLQRAMQMPVGQHRVCFPLWKSVGFHEFQKSI